MKQMKKFAISLLMVLTLTMSTAETLPTITPSITVEASTKMKLNKTKAFLIKGQALTLKLSGFKGKVIWSSSKPSIAAINSNGKVTARKKGSAVITAKVGTNKYTCKITVQTPTINKKSVTLTKGQKFTLKLKGTNQKIKWSSSRKDIVSVNSKGIATAKKVGKATITATVLNKKYKCNITVKAKQTDSKPSNTDSDSNDNNSNNNNSDTDSGNDNSNNTDSTEDPVTSYVYISPTGTKYHSISNCGRMNPNTATKLTEQEAINKGYTKCSKCF